MGRRGPELSPRTRSRICELHHIRYGAKRIHSLHPKWSLSTIKYILHREAICVNNLSQKCSSAPPKVSVIERDQIYDTISYTNLHVTNQDLMADID